MTSLFLCNDVSESLRRAKKMLGVAMVSARGCHGELSPTFSNNLFLYKNFA